MAEMKLAQTPYVYEEIYADGSGNIEDANGEFIAQLWNEYDPEFPYARHGGPLLAAAPELLEMCENALAFIEELEERNIVTDWNRIQQLRDVIAKARGENSE